MPTTFMDWVVIVGVAFTALGVFVAFMRRPKKTVNTIENGHRNSQSGGEGTTINKISNGNDNEQRG